MGGARVVWQWLLRPEVAPAPHFDTLGARALRAASARETWIALFSCLVLPTLVVLTVPSPLNQAGDIDAGLYTALIADYGQLTDRFGATYYATRISYLFPAHVLYTMFGFDAGYVLMRIAMLVLLCTSVFSMARSWLGLAVAVALSAIAACGPWVLRSLLWDYTDGAAVVYLFATFALVTDRSGAAWREVAAGGMAALAINASIFNSAIGGFFIASWFILLMPGPLDALRRVVLVATGFVAVYAVMIVGLYLAFPVMGPFFESVNVRTSQTLLSGGATVWRSTLPRILELGMYYSLVPLVTLVILGVMLLGGTATDGRSPEMRRFQWAAFVYLALICAFGAVLHLVLLTGTLGLPWGVVYAFPATLFGWGAILAPGLHRLVPRRQAIVAGATVAGVLAFFILARFWLPDIRGQEWDPLDLPLGVAGGLTLAAALVARLRAYALVLAVLFMAHVPYRQEANFHTMIHNRGSAVFERDVREGGLFLLALAGEHAPVADGRLVIWHPTPRPRGYQSLAAYLFWGYSLVDSSGGGLPQLTNDDEDDVRKSAYLVMLAPSADTLQAGFATLKERAVVYGVVRQGTWRGEQWSYEYALLRVGREEDDERYTDVVEGEYTLATDLQPSPDSAVDRAQDGIRLTTDPRGWAYSASVALGPQAQTRMGLSVLVAVEVQRGAFQIIVESSPNLVRPPPQGLVRAGQGVRIVRLPLDPTQDQTLIIANGALDGPSVGVVRRVAVIERVEKSAR